MRCDIISIFPEYLEPLKLSLPGQAQRKGLLDVAVHDLRVPQIREIDMNKFDAIEAASLRSDVPEFRAGDTLNVHVKVIEGTRSRVQVFKGVVIRRHGGGVGETFTVRKVSFGVGVERTFPLHSPNIDKIEVASRGVVRRAKLYYLRDLRGKAARIRERRETPTS